MIDSGIMDDIKINNSMNKRHDNLLSIYIRRMRNRTSGRMEESFILKNFMSAGKYIFLCFTALVILFPYIWMVLGSLKSDSEIFAHQQFFPSVLRFDNYPAAIKTAPFGQFFINSTIMCVISVTAELATCSLAAFAFAKINFKFKKIIFILFISAMMIPGEVTVLSNYLTAHSFGLINTYLGLTMTGLTSVFGMFLLRQFFMTLPNELMDAAKIDGCGRFRIYISIFMPLAKTALITVGIFCFISSWNAYMWPMVVTNRVSMRTVQTGLRYLIDPELGTRWPLVLAASTVIITPVMLIFIVLQRYFIEGVARSGIK